MFQIKLEDTRGNLRSIPWKIQVGPKKYRKKKKKEHGALNISQSGDISSYNLHA